MSLETASCRSKEPRNVIDEIQPDVRDSVSTDADTILVQQKQKKKNTKINT